MLLDLTKPNHMTAHRPPHRMPAMPEPPIMPTPPPMQVVDAVWGHPVLPKKQSEPSRVWCFFGVHKYQVKDESTWKKDNGRTTSKGPMYVLRCDVCGKMKAVCL